MAKATPKPPAGLVKVRLIVAHTDLGKPGEVVTMPAAKAKAHAELGLLTLETAAAKPKPPAPPADK